MVEGLDDFLDGNAPQVEPVAEVAPEVTPEPVVAEEPSGPVRDEKGRFAPKGEKEDAPPASEEVVYEGKATLAERRKRQEAEQRIAALEAQLQQLSTPPQQPVDMFEDPQAWQGQFGSQVVSQAVQQATLNAKLDMSEMMTRQANADFEDMKALFLDLAKDNPSLAQQCISDPHPWNKAYQIAKNHEKMQTLGATNVAELEARLREQIKAELASQKPQVELPTSLATAQPGSGPSVAAQSTGFTPLEEILKR